MPGLGKLQGTNDAYGMSEFNAIPYAQPPTGTTGRWQPPKPMESWGEETLNATVFGKACIQGATLGTPPPMDEDCLFLNVATPTALLTGDSKLPVMVWSESLATESPAHRASGLQRAAD